MKKGFTLIEVLAVLVILALIAVIAVPNTFKISADIKKELYCKKVDVLVNDAKRWGTDHISTLTDGSVCYKSFTISELVTDGITKKDSKNEDYLVLNPYSNAPMDDDKILLYKENERAYAYYSPINQDDEELLASCNVKIAHATDDMRPCQGD